MAEESITLTDSTTPTTTPATSATPASVGSILWNQNEVTPQQVYSANNIQTALTQQTARPDLSDPFGVYNYYMNSPDIQAARTQSQQYYKDLLGVRQTNRTQQQALENLPQALNVIRGEQAVAGNQAALREQSVSDSLSASQAWLSTLTATAQDKYNIAIQERSQIQDLIAQTGGKAKISYNDTFESALQKATQYLDKKSEKDAIKSLYMQTFGSSGKGKSTKEMEKKLKKYNKNALKQAKEKASMELQSAQLQLQQQRISLQKLQESLSTGTGYIGNIMDDYNAYKAVSGASQENPNKYVDQNPLG